MCARGQAAFLGCVPLPPCLCTVLSISDASSCVHHACAQTTRVTFTLPAGRGINRNVQASLDAGQHCRKTLSGSLPCLAAVAVSPPRCGWSLTCPLRANSLCDGPACFVHAVQAVAGNSMSAPASLLSYTPATVSVSQNSGLQCCALRPSCFRSVIGIDPSVLCACAVRLLHQERVLSENSVLCCIGGDGLHGRRAVHC